MNEELPKFKRQPDKVSCAPTAIYNALTFFGKASPGIRTIKRVCGTDEDGTIVEAFSKVLKMAFKGICKVEHPKYKKYRITLRAMFDGCGVCILYRDPLTGEGHYTFAFMRGWEFFIVNDEYRLVAPLDYDDLRLILKQKWTEVWIVRPNGKLAR